MHGTRWALVRAGGAVLVAAAVVTQLLVTVDGARTGGRDVATTLVNFVSFFTVLSNVSAAVVLAVAAARAPTGRADGVDPRPLAVALACVTTYMLVTGVVYNLLLRTVELPQGATVPWSNEVLHVVGPLLLLADLLVAPGRRALPWSTVGVVLVPPVAWIGYTLVRGPLTTAPLTGDPWWYPYPFLDPHTVAGGYAGVAGYVAGIAVVLAGFAALVVLVGRRRGAVCGGMSRPAG